MMQPQMVAHHLFSIHKNVTMESRGRENFLFTEAPFMWYDTF